MVHLGSTAPVTKHCLSFKPSRMFPNKNAVGSTCWREGLDAPSWRRTGCEDSLTASSLEPQDPLAVVSNGQLRWQHSLNLPCLPQVWTTALEGIANSEALQRSVIFKNSNIPKRFCLNPDASSFRSTGEMTRSSVLKQRKELLAVEPVFPTMYRQAALFSW